MSRILASFGIDLAATLAFVAIGMSTHDSSFADYPATAAPFVLALVAGWVVWLFLGRGTSPARILAGLVIWAFASGGGLALRSLLGDSVSGAFPFVTAVVLFALLLGWRGIVALTARGRNSTSR